MMGKARNKSRFVSCLASSIACALVLASCGGGPDTVQNDPPPGGGNPPPTPDTTPPSVPANLRIVSVTHNTVTVAWNAATDTGGSGVSSYRLTRNGAQIGGSITSTQFVDSSLTAATAYSYAVSAVDGAGNASAASGVVQGTTGPTPPLAGLDGRLSNTTCLAPDEPVVSTTVTTQQFTNLTFSEPLGLMQAPGNTTRFYVFEKSGVIRYFDNVASPTKQTYFDLSAEVNDSASEGGLLGMAFDPQYATNKRVYLSYTANPTGSGVLESRITRFVESGGTLTNREVLLTIQQPFDNHNGGNLAFGPDGFLYVGFGDGGSGGDPGNRAQDRSTLLGKMLRLNVSAAGAYTIPAGNPYQGSGVRCQNGQAAGGAMCAEIFAYGLRNPWRWSFDKNPSTPDLWLGDVGQGDWEEIDIITNGGNYGWKIREGKHCFSPSSGCQTAGLIDPVAEYDHTVGVSVTGGYVYRGSAIPSLQGRYVFGEFSNGNVFTLSSTFARSLLVDTNAQIASFAQDSDGELYIVDLGGRLLKIVPGGGGGVGNGIPTALSQSGCFKSGAPTEPVDALIPYAPIAPFFSDTAEKGRWMALPDSQAITVNNTTGDWEFPNRTVLVKNFTLNGNLIETRLFMRFRDTGNWAGYSYRWNAGHTDATLVTTATDVTIGSQTWTYPSPAQCLQCHTSAAGRSLGLETRQLNWNFTYPSTGRTANQIDTLEQIGAFTATPTRLAALPDPFGSGATADKARSYLHTNCSHCHRPSGGTPANIDLLYTTAMGSTATCNVNPTAGDLGVAGSKIIQPGDSAHSVLFLRMARRGANQMPPLASNVRDTPGETLIQQWINTAMDSNCQ